MGWRPSRHISSEIGASQSCLEKQTLTGRKFCQIIRNQAKDLPQETASQMAVRRRHHVPAGDGFPDPDDGEGLVDPAGIDASKEIPDDQARDLVGQLHDDGDGPLDPAGVDQNNQDDGDGPLDPSGVDGADQNNQDDADGHLDPDIVNGADQNNQDNNDPILRLGNRVLSSDLMYAMLSSCCSIRTVTKLRLVSMGWSNLFSEHFFYKNYKSYVILVHNMNQKGEIPDHTFFSIKVPGLVVERVNPRKRQ